ncbi:5478_t:CDS:2, partial [Racocetra persica]
LSNVVGIPKHDGAAVFAGPNKDIIFLFGGEFENARTQSPRRAFLHSVTDVTDNMYFFGGAYG